MTSDEVVKRAIVETVREAEAVRLVAMSVGHGPSRLVTDRGWRIVRYAFG